MYCYRSSRSGRGIYIFIATGALRVVEVYIFIATGAVRVEEYTYVLLKEL